MIYTRCSPHPLPRLALIALMMCLLTPLPIMAGQHALTLFGEPKYGPDVEHFDYVNPDAPKGGTARMAYPITFDSLNPFILKGLAAPSITMIYDTLMVKSLDEPQTYYPLVAKEVSLAKDGRSMTFTLDERARFHDGTPVTVEDVIFSLKMMKEEAHPAYQLQYRDVERAVESGERQVTFEFATANNRDLPFIVAGLPVLSKAFYQDHPFAETSLDYPLTSGPYKVAEMEAGRSITYERVADYWGKDLPSQRGHHNIGRIRYEVYRDETVSLEAFKAHEYDYREEYIARNWARAYDFGAVDEGEVILDETPHSIPRGMQAFIFNLRQPELSDRRVREAISLTFDFEWMNRTLFYGAYERNNSFFQNTPFAARMPPSKEEKALLAPYREELPPAVFNRAYQPPKSDGSGFIRERLMKADKLLNEAGWVVKDGKRVHEETGEVMELEFLAQQSSLERLVMAMQRNLDILGIDASYRTVDESQYQKRRQMFDFDITVIWWNRGVIYPGNEQQSYWHCEQGKVKGGSNLSGYCEEAVDMLVGKISEAETLETLRTAARALDRVLLHEHVVIPHFSISHFRMAYWDIFGIPENRPPYGRGFETWWIKDAAR